MTFVCRMPLRYKKGRPNEGGLPGSAGAGTLVFRVSFQAVVRVDIFRLASKLLLHICGKRIKVRPSLRIILQ